MSIKSSKNSSRSPIKREEPEFEQQVVDIARVTRVTAGGKRLRFRACVIIGDKKGRVACGVAKGGDVAAAVEKAITQGKKQLINVLIIEETLPHALQEKYKSAKILIRPASKGRGIIAGGAVRSVLELAGYKSATAKMLGSRNKINNARCTINALKRLRIKK